MSIRNSDVRLSTIVDRKWHFIVDVLRNWIKRSSL